MPKSTFTDGYATMLAILIQLRKDAGITQIGLSERLGKEQPFISKIERGVRRIDLIEFYAIVVALRADPNAVFRRITRLLPKTIKI